MHGRVLINWISFVTSLTKWSAIDDLQPPTTTHPSMSLTVPGHRDIRSCGRRCSEFGSFIRTFAVPDSSPHVVDVRVCRCARDSVNQRGGGGVDEKAKKPIARHKSNANQFDKNRPIWRTQIELTFSVALLFSATIHSFILEHLHAGRKLNIEIRINEWSTCFGRAATLAQYLPWLPMADIVTFHRNSEINEWTHPRSVLLALPFSLVSMMMMERSSIRTYESPF